MVNAVLEAVTDRMFQDGRFADRAPMPSGAVRTAEALVEMAERSTGTRADQPAVHPDVVVVEPVERLIDAEPDPFAPPPDMVGTGPVAMSDDPRGASPRHRSCCPLEATSR